MRLRLIDNDDPRDIPVTLTVSCSAVRHNDMY
jgi:hypothetical protein